MATRGVTVLELLISVFIAALLAALAIPAFSSYIAGYRATATINQFAGAVALARTAAVLNRRTVLMCPSTGARCGPRNSWANGTVVFADDNRNGHPDIGEPLYARLSGFDHGDVRWRAFRNRTVLTFKPTGLTDWQNGNFIYCPEGNDPRHARMLILNYAGRVRAAPDRNGNGIREDARGRDIRC